MTLEEARLSIENLEKKIADLKESIHLIEKEPIAWIPEMDECYYHIQGDCAVHVYDFDGCEYDVRAYSYGNCFKTQQRAEQVSEKFRMLLKLEQYHDMFCPDYVPDWDNYLDKKFYVCYDHRDKSWKYDYSFNRASYSQVYFDSFETVQKVCELLNTEN